MHTIIGYDLLKDSKSRFLAEGAMIAHTHHEKWNGSGYPLGLTGVSIPLSGRIVSIVDVFDALISDRPYKQAWSKEAALDYIVEQQGKHFDPELVELFRTHFAEFASVWESLRGASDAFASRSG
jgi:response regulator RpfG family c-di-GMP phosphodiesterase